MTSIRTHRPIWPGTDGPRRDQPVRARGSFRRTTTIDISVADDLSTLAISGSGRDLTTDDAGRGEVLDTAHMEADLTLDERTVTRLEAGHKAGPLQVDSLIGSQAGSGFRKAFRNEFPALACSGGLLALLLDDLPVASVISGMAVVRARERLGPIEGGPRTRRGAGVDVCAGWQRGSLMTLARSGEAEFDFAASGPITPAPEADVFDPMAWHHTGPIRSGHVRRRRRLDIWRAAPQGPLLIDAWFRDSYGEAPDVESGVHEYDVVAIVDPASHIVLEVNARPRVLPAPECPEALGSVQRIQGRPLDEIRDFVRASFTGPSTCTHLNDTLRAMGDLFAAIPYVIMPAEL